MTSKKVENKKEEMMVLTVKDVQIKIDELKFKTKEEKKYTEVKSKSEMFRQLYDLGLEVAEIARETDSHYSFVYGVISSSRTMRETAKLTKSDIIREMADKEMTPGEIAKQLNSNYSFVYNVIKKHRDSSTEQETAVAEAK